MINLKKTHQCHPGSILSPKKLGKFCPQPLVTKKAFHPSTSLVHHHNFRNNYSPQLRSFCQFEPKSSTHPSSFTRFKRPPFVSNQFTNYRSFCSSPSSTPKKKFYALTMFPYPSGQLHMGHVRVYSIADTIARLKKMQGYEVLSPMGWDAFGLPAENAARVRKVDPKTWTDRNIEEMKESLIRLKTDFSWNYELKTCDPKYYKWTQKLFLKLYEKGLVARKESLVNWDPIDETVLANEQVDSLGRSWRSGAVVEKKSLIQWFFKITHFTEQLLGNLPLLEKWPASVKGLQEKWIGKSEGVRLSFSIENMEDRIEVFTTRPDTIFGVSFLAVCAEHPIVSKYQGTKKIELETFQKELSSQTLVDRSKMQEKKGIYLGVDAIHPLTKQKIPIWVTNYVLPDYGTGAVMGVPSDDERDNQFAEQYGLSVIPLYDPETQQLTETSQQFAGLEKNEAMEKIGQFLEKESIGKMVTDYKIRDWLISRQRYWGTPIPMIHCKACGVVPVPDHHLPVQLPDISEIDITSGSPLKNASSWVETACPQCNGPAQRETDTMDTFVDSAWYFLRYPDANNDAEMFSQKQIQKWLPVDIYIGGQEHAILHLLYARFIMNFLYRENETPAAEPFKELLTQGMVTGKTFRVQDSGRVLKEEEVDFKKENVAVEKETQKPVLISWEKMSKSKFNGVDPGPIIEEYGADTVRLYMLFKAPIPLDLEWDTRDIKGLHRWLRRLSITSKFIQENITLIDYASKEKLNSNDQVILHAVHNAIQEGNRVLDYHGYNVLIAQLMKASNVLSDFQNNHQYLSPAFVLAFRSLLVMLAPMAPETASNLWKDISNLKIDFDDNLFKDYSQWAGEVKQLDIHQQNWPSHDPIYTSNLTRSLVVSLNGKKFTSVEVPQDLENEKLEAFVLKELQHPKIEEAKNNLKKVIVTRDGKLINFVTNK